MKKLLLFTFIIISSQAVLAADDKDDIIDQQKELRGIKSDVKKGRKKLDSLKSIEINIGKQLSESDQKIATNKEVVKRLNRELNQIKKDISNTENKIELSQTELDLAHKRYLGNIRQFYFVSHRDVDLFSKDPNEELRLNRQINYLTNLAGFESGNIMLAAQFLDDTKESFDQMSGESRKISKLKQKKETSTSLAVSKKKKLDRNLAQVKRKKKLEADRILMLEQAAREMENIIARLQQELLERSAIDRDDDSPTFFTALKGQLLAPYRGKIIETFGYKTDKITNLKSFSPGVTINGRAGRSVIAVASGTVAYVGELRGYGNFIILNHDDSYYTTYAGLGQTAVATGEYVLAGRELAVTGSNGVLKFELRQGTKPLDPIEWIKIDSF